MGTQHLESLQPLSLRHLLSRLGLQVVSVCEDSAKKHLAPGTMPYTPCVEFGAMDLSDYDSDQDADYSPSESDSDDSIEYDSEAEVSEVSEVDEVSEDEASEDKVEEGTAEVEA